MSNPQRTSSSNIATAAPAAKRIQIRTNKLSAKSKPAKQPKKKRSQKVNKNQLEKTVIERSLEEQGVDRKTAGALATGVYYDGIPMANVTIRGDPADIIYNAQICTLHMLARYPAMFLTPANDVTGQAITPTKVVAYLVAAFCTRARALGLLTGENAEAYTDLFNKEYLVPTGFAKYMEYAFRFEGPPRMQTVFNLEDDFTMPLQEVGAPAAATNYNLSQLQIFQNPSTDNACMFPVVINASTSEWVITGGPYAPAITGLVTGVNPFINTQFMDFFSNFLTGMDTIETVAFEKISCEAPDASAFGAPFGTSTSASNWTQYTGVMYPTSKYDIDMTIIIRPNCNILVNPIAPFPLGMQESVPQACAPNYVSDKVKYTASGIIVTQEMDWFYFHGVRSEYSPGKWRAKKGGFRYPNGKPISRFFQVITREVDTYGLTRAALIGLADFAASSLLSSLLTDDYIDNFVQVFETLLVAKVFQTGNWSLQGGIGANSQLSIQQLLPAMDIQETAVPLFVKAIIDNVGHACANGRDYLPQVTVNAYGTISDGVNISWTSLPRFGSVLYASGSPRYIENVVGSVAFPFVPSLCPVTSSNGSQPNNTGAGILGGAGQFATATSGTLAGFSWFNAAVKGNSYSYMLLAQALVPFGTFNVNYVFSQSNIAGMAQGVASLWTTQQVAGKGQTGTLNNEEVLGGPGMLAIQLNAPRNPQSILNAALPHVSLNVGPLALTSIVPATQPFIYTTYINFKNCYYAPLSPIDHGLAVGFPVCALYKQTNVPYTMTTAFIEIPIAALGGTAVDSAMAKLTEIDGAVAQTYSSEAYLNHTATSHKSIIRKTSYVVGKDCLRKALLGLGDKLSEQFTHTDWLKVSKSTCRWGVTAAGVGFLRPACSLIPRVYKAYKSVRTHYDSSKKGGDMPVVMGASH